MKKLTYMQTLILRYVWANEGCTKIDALRVVHDKTYNVSYTYSRFNRLIKRGYIEWDQISAKMRKTGWRISGAGLVALREVAPENFEL